MRGDMKRKLVETYRTGSGKFRRSGAGKKKGKCMNPDVARMRRERVDLEEYIDEDGEKCVDLVERAVLVQSPKARPVSWNRKEFGENLNPLWRYLQKQVGRPWDAVYSEVCENMDRRSAVGAHIFEHLYDFAIPAREVVFVDDKPHRLSWSGTPVPITYSGKVGQFGNFWVDPRDGILKKGTKEQESVWSRERRLIREDREDRLRKIGHLWMSRHPETELWFVLDCKKQQYVEEVVTFQRVAFDGQLVKKEYTKKTPVFEGVPFPEGLLVPEGMVVLSCKSASKKDLKKI